MSLYQTRGTELEAITNTSVAKKVTESAEVLQRIANDQSLLDTLIEISEVCIDALKSGKKILFMGNGGSAADSQHLAAELVSRFEFDRPGLPAIALTTDTSALTAIGNDYGFDRLFARQIEALGVEGDVLIGISTSGNSENINVGLKAAKEKGLVLVGWTGNKQGAINQLTDYLVEVPSANTAEIQVGHIVIGHTICGFIEKALFSESAK